MLGKRASELVVTMPAHRPIHIALNFNDTYWALAYAAMRSICLSSIERKKVVFHLVHTPLSHEHAAVLDQIPAEFGATLCHYNPEENTEFLAITAKLPTNARFPAIVYGRLLLDQLLPPEVERVIYLDCDIMVRRPIEALYDIDLEGKALAAVADAFHDGIKLGRDIRTKQSPFDSAEPYFNSGVLLIDRRALGKADIGARIPELEKDGVLAKLYFDQDLLNYIFRDQWLELDWRFNLINPRKSHETLGAHILHFTGTSQPWNLINHAAFSRTYRHVMTNAVFYKFWRERMRNRVRKLFRLRSST